MMKDKKYHTVETYPGSIIDILVFNKYISIPRKSCPQFVVGISESVHTGEMTVKSYGSVTMYILSTIV